MLPIGVLLPTRDAAAFLPHHLETMREWVGQVQEVVVVDSRSKDGTLDLIKAGLRHPNLRIFEHPPGLYQSWNHGIQQIQAEHCYVSTVGDSITLDGLRHLVEVIQAQRCDVVVSKPDFIDVHGRPIRPSDWPIDDVVRTLHLEQPVALEGMGLFLFTLVNYRDAILGSSASNLYRTRCVQKYPFPVDYGTAGDGGWGLTNCVTIRLGVTSRVFSNIREHPKSYSKAEYEVDQFARKLLARIRRTYQEEAQRNAEFAALARRLKVDRMIELLEQRLEEQERLEQYRRGHSIWVLHPSAWRARRRRNALHREVLRLRDAALPILFPEQGKAGNAKL